MKQSNAFNTCLRLFLTMFKIGAFTFGGGYAMISLLENELVAKKQWLDRDEFLDMVAIAESTPGPVAINMATYVGYKLTGVLGSAAATLGVVLPSFIIIFAISLFFDRFIELKYVGYAFSGIRVCVVYLIVSAGIKMLGGIKKTPFNLAILIAVVAAMVAFSIFAVKFSSIFYILICGCIGLAVYFVKSLASKGGDGK